MLENDLRKKRSSFVLPVYNPICVKTIEIRYNKAK